MDKKAIKVAVFPVAGLGTRFLPATKVTPKEMFPVVDKPLIQYAVEEAQAAGIEHMIFVTSSKKKVLEDHFDAQYELLAHLKERNKESLLGNIEAIVSSDITFSYVRQSEALGLGHAVLMAQPLVQDQPFAVLLADDLVVGGSCLKAMVEQYQRQERVTGSIATELVADDRISQYGVVETNKRGEITSIIEKPQPNQTPSRQAVIGRYILPPSIFGVLRSLPPGAGGEIQLTDAIAKCLDAEVFQTLSLDALDMLRYDCGSRLGFLQANLEVALCREDLAEDVKALLARHAIG